MHYVVYSHGQGAVAAEGTGRIVSYDYRTGAKAPLPEAIAARLRDLQGAG